MNATPTSRRRAPAMSPDERRAAIVEATLPLLAEHGANVTTSQIASAAGVAEGTVFRVFKDKTELLKACLEQVMRPDASLDLIAAVPRGLPLTERLSRVAHDMADRMHLTSTVVHALIGTGYRLERLHHDGLADREKWMADITSALADLFGADASALRLPALRAARMFLGVVFAATMPGRMRGEKTSADAADVDELIDVFVHGVLKE